MPAYILPLVPASAATLLKTQGRHVIWNDCLTNGLIGRDFSRYSGGVHPDIIAIETKTPVIKQHWYVIDDIKKEYPEIRVVLMGDHVTVLPEGSILNSKADFVLVSEHRDLPLSGLIKCSRGDAPMPPGIYYSDGETIANSGVF